MTCGIGLAREAFCAPQWCACTASMRRELRSSRDQSPKISFYLRNQNPQKRQSPVTRASQRCDKAFPDGFAKTGTPPAIAQSLPSFGDLGTGRPGIPLFTSGAHNASSDEPHPVLGTLVQAGRESPSLHPGLMTRQRRAPPGFGNLGTGRPGIPSFIAPGDGSPAASDLPLRHRTIRHATAGLPADSAATLHHSSAPANSRPCR